MSETLTCPVCRNNVSGTSSMCLSCHLPIRDVRANQQLAHRRRSKLAPFLLLLGVLILASAIGLRLRADSPPGDDGGPDGTVEAGQEVAYSELDVGQSDGRFDGTIELTNPTEVHTNVYVQVHVYDGEQEVGELSGDVTLKPHSTAVADLMSADEFRSFDNSVVELIALPAAVD